MHYRMREEKIQNIAPSSCNHFERSSSTTLCFCFRLFAFELRAVKDIEMAREVTVPLSKRRRIMVMIT